MQLARYRIAPASLGHNVFVTGVTRVNDQLIQLLDVELILSGSIRMIRATSIRC